MAGVPLLFAAGAGCGAPDGEDVVGVTSAIENGTPTFAHPEVGKLVIDGIGSCTATMVTQGAFTTAAHCVKFALNFTGSAHMELTESTPSGLQTWNLSVTQIRSFFDKSGGADVALGIMNDFAPPQIVGMQMAANYVLSSSGTYTQMGYGCKKWPNYEGAGVKRYGTYTGTLSSIGCPGDSGGPTWVGGLGSAGPAFLIASQGSSGSDPDNPAFVPTQRIEDTLRQRGAGREYNFDRPGFDYAAATATDEIECTNRCLADGNCRAFTFSFLNNTCWLKNAIPATVPNNNVVSGIGAGLRGNIDFPNFDISQFNTTDPDLCESTCARTSGCTAYTLAGGICRLKNGNPVGLPCASCISGRARGLEPNVNRPGWDYKNVTTASAGLCATTCAQDDQCGAFTWVQSTQKCFLKSGMSAAQAGTGMTSGVKHSMEYDVDRPGQDYRHWSATGMTPTWCQAACSRESQCVAWTMTPPSNYSATCWLKSGLPGRVESPGMISGRRGMDFF